MLMAGRSRGRIARRATMRCLLAVAATYAVVEVLGHLARRPRPFAAEPAARGLVHHAPGRSFPSRHVASAVAMAVVMRPAIGGAVLPMELLAAALGLSRIRTGLHYPSDVLAGAVLGYAVGRVFRGRSYDDAELGA